MAKVRGAYGGSESRGRIGGIVLNVWRGLQYAKASHAPAQPRSKNQLQIRAWNTYLTRYWSEIDAAERLAWNAYAVTHTETDGMGSTKRLTGLNWFCRCNIRLLAVGIPVRDTPPATAAPNAPAAFLAANGVSQSVITWTPVAASSLCRISIYGPHSKGRLGKREQTIVLKAHDGEAGTYTATSLQPGRYTFFACILDGLTGLISPYVSDIADVTLA